MARRIPALLPKLAALGPRLIVLPTPNSRRVLAPRELALALAALAPLSGPAGHHLADGYLVESYFDAAILPRPAPGALLVAPCDFNSLNKLAQGIADNLPLSVAAEAIGRRTPVTVAISVNAPLWAHPRAQESAATLRSWGCQVFDPVPEGETLTMVPDEVLLEAARTMLE